MNDIWLSYVFMVCVFISFITVFLGELIAKKLYRQLCPDTLPSAFNLLRYMKMKKCLFALDEKDLTLSDMKQIRRFKLVLKIENAALTIIAVIAIWVFAKQGFKFV